MDALNNALKLFKAKHIRIASLGIILCFFSYILVLLTSNIRLPVSKFPPLELSDPMSTSPNSTFTISVLPPFQEITPTLISSNLLAKVQLLDITTLKE